ncbi:hypothetical protein EJB05_42421, partial [Eragrostis curvula]
MFSPVPPPFRHTAGGAPPPPPFFGIPVRQVWANNLDAEVRAVRALAANARYVAVNVQYPGVVFNAAGNADPCAVTAEERYAAVKANVDALKPLQLGIAVGTHDGRCVAWEFNLSGFDRAADQHAPGSVAYLAGRGMDLDAHRARGVPAARLAAALHRCGLLRGRGFAWVTYAGVYHVAYLLKIVTGGQPLPGDVAGFLDAVRGFLGEEVYDVARLVVDCPTLPVGLERVANALGLAPPLWSPRLAGAGAALALQAFAALEFNVFRGDVSRYRGLLNGLQVT